MKNSQYLLICAVLIVGCSPKKPAVVDPCSSAPTSCHGVIGESPADVSHCAKLISCYNWRMEAR